MAAGRVSASARMSFRPAGSIDSGCTTILSETIILPITRSGHNDAECLRE